MVPSPEAAVPMMLRRRFTALPRHALEVAATLPDAEDAIYIVASRHGDYSRLLRLLTELATDAAVSPADFSLSVHNALAGVLSIVKGNRQGHTAIAAGADTFIAGMTEAMSALRRAPEQPILLLFYDEPLPEIYRGVVHTDASHALALAMLLRAVTGKTGPDGRTILAEMMAGGSEAVSDIIHAEAFLKFVLTGAEIEETRGRAVGWRWRHV
jgi:hypothetical protein